MNKTACFLEIFKKAEKRYKSSNVRLASEGWEEPWQTLIVTVMSAQSRDETTIPIAEELFKKYPTLRSLAGAQYPDVLVVLKSLNYNRTKARHVIACAKVLIADHGGKVPDDMDKLVRLPGVGRKTAALVLSEVFHKPAVCVDTHVHRIANVFGFVQTRAPAQTEKELMGLVPRQYWSRINPVFVRWGKDVPGRDRERFLAKLAEK